MNREEVAREIIKIYNTSVLDGAIRHKECVVKVAEWHLAEVEKAREEERQKAIQICDCDCKYVSEQRVIFESLGMKKAAEELLGVYYNTIQNRPRSEVMADRCDELIKEANKTLEAEGEK